MSTRDSTVAISLRLPAVRDNAPMEIRLLEPGDEAIVERLATREPRTALLQDPRTIFLVAFDDDGAPIGFVLAYELPRRHGFNVTLIVYEVEVDDAHRRRGIARALLRELEQIARARGIEEASCSPSADNLAAMRLYESAGGKRRRRRRRMGLRLHGRLTRFVRRPRTTPTCSSRGTRIRTSRATGTTRRSRARRCSSGCGGRTSTRSSSRRAASRSATSRRGGRRTSRGAAASTCSSCPPRAGAGSAPMRRAR